MVDFVKVLGCVRSDAGELIDVNNCRHFIRVGRDPTAAPQRSSLCALMAPLRQLPLIQERPAAYSLPACLKFGI